MYLKMLRRIQNEVHVLDATNYNHRVMVA
uniref:Uncharacterized protein n=1 Tax=Arundo donax TaxID=35708 RepID=A0A0A9CG56_ARUDO